MTLTDIQSAEWRARAVARVQKRLFGWTRGQAAKRPVFVAGAQRSGTTMLMNIFHLHPDTDVFDEAASSTVFADYRVRSLNILKDSVAASRYPYPCYKIISDSHILPRFLPACPDSKIIWMYREPVANAASRLQKWPHATVAIRLVCEGKPGGGWFAEGVSDAVRKRLQSLDRSQFSDFDYACLTWWARNQLYFELQLSAEPRVRVLRYERLVTTPSDTMRDLLDWLEMPWSARSMRFVHARSTRKKDLPPLDGQVTQLCNELLANLDQAHSAQWKT